MKNTTLFIFLFSLSLISFAKDSKQVHSNPPDNRPNILECLQLLGNNYVRYSSDDAIKDTVVDLLNGYFEASSTRNWGDGDHKIILFQATLFRNYDGTTTLGITRFYADMQCANYYTNFYSIPESGDTIIELDSKDVLPEISFYDYLINDQPIDVINKYTPAIKESGYLGDDFTTEKVLQEFYDYHFMMPQKGIRMESTLTTCDFIPTNETTIEREDWDIIETQYKSLSFKYDKKRKRFVR